MHPPLSVPLPPPKALVCRAGMDETSTHIGVKQPVLPFSTVVQASDSLAGSFTVERYAAFCVEFVEAPDQREGTLTKYGITSEQKAKLDAYWAQKMAKDPAEWLAWDRACTAHRVALSRKGQHAH